MSSFSKSVFFLKQLLNFVGVGLEDAGGRVYNTYIMLTLSRITDTQDATSTLIFVIDTLLLTSDTLKLP